MLIVTNIESTLNLLTETVKDAEVVAWNDPLHFGKIVSEGDLNAFSERRASVLGSYGWDEDGMLGNDFVLRNQSLELAVETGQRIVLYFGPSVRDQLQLAQLCDYFCCQSSETIDLLTIWVLEEPVELGSDLDTWDPLEDGAKTINTLIEYRDLWRAYEARDPRFLEQFYQGQSNGLLKSVSESILRNFPSSENGLSVHETQILDAISSGVNQPRELFEVYQEMEEFPHIINWEFWSILHRLSTGIAPYLEAIGRERFLCPPRDLAWEAFYAQRLRLTEKGNRVITPDLCSVDSHYPNRWIGGVRLHQNNRWYWDYFDRKLTSEPRVPESALV